MEGNKGSAFLGVQAQGATGLKSLQQLWQARRACDEVLEHDGAVQPLHKLHALHLLGRTTTGCRQARFECLPEPEWSVAARKPSMRVLHVKHEA